MQDILDYLSMFQEDTSAIGKGSPADSAHPALVVVDAFHTEELAATNFLKIQNFLEDACKVLGRPFTKVELTATSFCKLCFFFTLFYFAFFTFFLYSLTFLWGQIFIVADRKLNSQL